MTESMHVIETPALLTIYEVAQQALLWQEQLKVKAPIVWSLEALAEFDAAGLQLLIVMANAIWARSEVPQERVTIAPPLNPDIANWLMPRLSKQQGVDHA
ncbi:hypothetical protein [Alishewanella longhuensis]